MLRLINFLTIGHVREHQDKNFKTKDFGVTDATKLLQVRVIKYVWMCNECADAQKMESKKRKKHAKE